MDGYGPVVVVEGLGTLEALMITINRRQQKIGGPPRDDGAGFFRTDEPQHSPADSFLVVGRFSRGRSRVDR